jgi:hypothetical protein
MDSALNIITWLWGTKYSHEYLWRLYRGVRRNLKQPFRFLVMTERQRELIVPEGRGFNIERHAINDLELLRLPGCFARLRMFDSSWQQDRKLNGRVVCLDLDIVITGALDDLFDRDDSFIVLQGANSANPCPYNCSVFMFQAGAHHQVWTDFSLQAAQKISFYQFPDDQGWIHDKIPHAAAWPVGSSGIYAFRKPRWPPNDQLPADARIVAFPGGRDPAGFVRQLGWIRQHWI